jgi:hypothetical protein
MKKSLVLHSSRAVKAKSGMSRSRSDRPASGLFHAVGHDQKKFPPITVEEFDRRAENGDDLSPYFSGKWMTPAQFARHLRKIGVQVPDGL